MEVRPWSPSALDDLINCPRQFYGVRVLKKFPQVSTPELSYGNYVHKAFENRQGTKDPLPPDLGIHETFMQKIEQKDGEFYTEHKTGFDKQGKVCSFWAKDVWCRFIIDYQKINGDQGFLVDYKTGKTHQKFRQLALAAIYMFQMYPDVQLVNAQYYWTQIRDTTKKVWARKEIPELWAMFIPDLKLWKEAFKTDQFPPRQSGLCNGWCPDTECQFWKPKRERT